MISPRRLHGSRHRPGLASSTVSSTLSSTHRLVESGPTQGPARRHWAASPRVSVPGARHTNHGTRITERDAVERHLGADPFRVRELAMRPRPRGCSDLQFQRTRSGTRSRSACTRPHLFVAEAQQHLTTPSGRVNGIVCRPCCVGSESMMCCPRSAACITATILSHAWNVHDERSHGEAGVSETSGAR